ncbi:hypothetical protein BDW22DRAFT_312769 [Trametopsis cervina]|nr:hypothetical protein BDW22DRAFT_312769 [Trametopsis cervina]
MSEAAHDCQFARRFQPGLHAPQTSAGARNALLATQHPENTAFQHRASSARQCEAPFRLCLCVGLRRAKRRNTSRGDTDTYNSLSARHASTVFASPSESPSLSIFCVLTHLAWDAEMLSLTASTSLSAQPELEPLFSATDNPHIHFLTLCLFQAIFKYHSCRLVTTADE